jgi:phosphoribosyl-ATP pyrophosphohydrolase
MARNKEKEEEKLQHKIQTRINTAKHTELVLLAAKTGNNSLSDLLRDILYHRPLILKTRDATLDHFMPELIRLRKELNHIGVNINQVTHHFNQSDEQTRRLFYAMKVSQRFDVVINKSEEILYVIEKLGERWLQKS